MKNKQDMIAYCGLYCADCFMHKGTIADLARDLRKELRKNKMDRFARLISKYWKPYANYDTTYELLGMMVKLRCKRACRNGGGPPNCKIRMCCVKKSITGCWECGEFETCRKLDFLKAIHKDGHIKNLRKLRKQGANKFLRGKRDW